MTVDEYLEEVLENISSANTQGQISGFLKEARRILDSSDLSKQTIRSFWVNLYNAVDTGRGRKLFEEAQVSTALNAQVEYALSVIAQLSDYYAEAGYPLNASPLYIL